MYLRKGVGSVTLAQGVTRVEDSEEVPTIDTPGPTMSICQRVSVVYKIGPTMTVMQY